MVNVPSVKMYVYRLLYTVNFEKSKVSALCNCTAIDPAAPGIYM